MRWIVIALLGGCSAANGIADYSGAKTAVPAASFDAADYAACAACHLADGQGVPGAFPPLRNRSAAIARVEGGREYLITVASFGLMGEIRVENIAYAGVMPGQKGAMGADAIAGALNFLVFGLSDRDPAGSGIEPFTAAEVLELQSRVAAGGPVMAARLRAELMERHGDRWPQ